jgi:hypothetical protein
MSEQIDLVGLQQDALRVMREVLRDPDASSAERLRAGEAIMRAELSPTGASAQGQALGLDDQALLAIARGADGEGRTVGGTPPLMGPVTSRAGAVPSHAPTVVSEIQTPSAERVTPDAPDVPRETNPFLIRPAKGTQLGLPNRILPGGPKLGVPLTATPTPHIASDGQIDDHLDPCS